jgi:type III pantothenate kinase
MLLAIDVGNTNIVLGVFEGRTARRELAPGDAARAHVRRDRHLDRSALRASQHGGRQGRPGIVMGSVVPPLTGTFMAMAQRYFKHDAAQRRQQRRHGHADLYKNPAEVGADRIVNGPAAYRLHGRGAAAPMIVVDFRDGDHVRCDLREGGVSGRCHCAGLQISADALFQRAAPSASASMCASRARSWAEPPWARIESGLYYGYVGWSKAWCGG